MFGLGFFEIAASLGVPGFALGIFALLFYSLRHTFHEHPSYILPYIVLTFGVVAFALYWFRPQSSEADYSVRVIALDPDGAVLEDVKVTSTLGGESKIVDGGIEFSISKAKVPSDGKLMLIAEYELRDLIGSKEVVLSNDDIKPVTIDLEPKNALVVSGFVRDVNNDAISGVRVSLGNADAITGETGRFSLSVEYSQGPQVQVHAQKSGYKSESQFALVNGDSVTIILTEDASP